MKKKFSKPKEIESMKLGWLYGWKDIADFAGMERTAIKRYERTTSIPIHRLPKTNKPVAIRDELDEWLKKQKNLRIFKS